MTRIFLLLCLLPLPVLAQSVSPFKVAPAPTVTQHPLQSPLFSQQPGQQRPLLQLAQQFGPQLIQAAPTLLEQLSQSRSPAVAPQSLQSPVVTVPSQLQSPQFVQPGQVQTIHAPFYTPPAAVRVPAPLPPWRSGRYEVRYGKVYYYPER